MTWIETLASFASGFLNGFAQEYGSPAVHARPTYAPPRATFQSLIRHLASEFNADVHWDEDGDAAAALIVRVQGDDRLLCISLHDDAVYLSAPSNIKFAAGCLPRHIAAFLSNRNKELEFADWDAVDKNGMAYFTLKARGHLDRISLDVLKVAIKKMLVEALILDTFLRKEG
jgi:hypothetical protein